MCTKKCFRMPTLVILGVIFTIVLVFITGITLTNSINISNIVKLREKVASDSAAANSANAAQTRAALVETQYSTLQQHHLSRSDLNYITANHPKNLQRFQSSSSPQQPEQQLQQQPLLPPHVSATATANNHNKIIIEIGISNFSLPQKPSTAGNVNKSTTSLTSSSTSSASSTDANHHGETLAADSATHKATSVIEDLVAPLNGAIIDGHIESISVPATSEIRQQLNETFKYFGENFKQSNATTTVSKTVTSTSQNETTLNSDIITVPTQTQEMHSQNNSSSSNVAHLPLTKNATSSAEISLSAAPSPTSETFGWLLNNSLNSLTSANASFAATLPAITNDTETTSLPPTVGPPFLGSLISAAAVPATNQLSIEDHNPGMIDFEKRNYVKKMMQHAWQNYKLYAWGKNELRPLSQRAHIGSIFGSQELGATIIDGLDTLYIMGLENEYKEGRDWIERKFSLDNVTADLSVFETNIRFIGGLLTMYAFTGDNLYKERAQHVADKLLPAFQTPTGIPYGLVNPKTGLSKNYGWASGASSILSEFGTLHLEFSYLSDITGNPLYKERVQTIRQILKEIEKPKGLYPNFLNPKTGKWGQLHMSLGALGDSFYEYLLKAWLQSGQTDEEARQMFDEAMVAIIDHMVRTSLNGLTYVSDLKFDRLEHKMDHLACFAGGLFALGANTRQNEHTEKFMSIGKGITNTCHESYIRSTTHLGPEAFRFSEAAEARALKSNEKYYILRPETVESYLVLWRLTHDQKYRDWGWDAVQALEQHCRTPHGYSGIKNVYQDAPQKDDVQQSFFLAETLKYLYLLFSDDSLIPLDEWVFNTEAHPLPIKGSNIYYRQAASTSAAATNAS
ncbi:mannosyl-oligosaccharide alpha-1,2-mannosidase IA isoform X1 [Stomoxys calcitrans]|uniref:alpha-1,2-Mannosidase n=1 Tax=Stomoxys calcitrans TaxID=35570 RepID=A0A1I8PYM2_STOCA|nr:mannosyl-oligosaccharide alpha-1,2-mannosidase IA isoform X1 [Stomoxys calcitrans]